MGNNERNNGNKAILKKYYEEACKYPTLKKETLQLLLEAYKRIPDRELKEKIFNSMRGYVMDYIIRTFNFDDDVLYSVDDVVQEAYCMLWYIIDLYDSEKGLFSDYLHICLNNLRSLIFNKIKRHSLVLSTTEIEEIYSADLFENVIDDVDKDLLRLEFKRLFESLPGRQSEVMLIRYGYDDETYAYRSSIKVAEILGITDVNVRECSSKAIKGLKKRGMVEGLRKFL